MQPMPHFVLVLPQDPQPQQPAPQAPPLTEPRTGETGAQQQDPGGGPRPAQPQQPCGGTETFLYMGLFLALMWLMVFRPANKQRKQQQQMLGALKKGDPVVTTGGMHGVIHSLDERTITLEVDGIKLVFDRSAVARVARDEPARPAAKA